MGLWGDLGASFRHPWAPFGYPWGPCWCLVGTLGCGPGPLGPLLWKRLEKGTQNDRPNGGIFNDILSFCRKWQTAFGLRLRGRIRVLAPCFHSLGLHGCPLFFQCFFDVFWGAPGSSFLGFGVRGGTQLIEVRNKTLTTCDLVPLLPLRYGGFYVQPGGLVPRARGRIYVAFGEHPAAGGFLLEVRSHWMQP